MYACNYIMTAISLYCDTVVHHDKLVQIIVIKYFIIAQAYVGVYYLWFNLHSAWFLDGNTSTCYSLHNIENNRMKHYCVKPSVQLHKHMHALKCY